MAKVKITVAKRMSNQDLVAEYGEGVEPLCEVVEDGQEYTSEDSGMPAGFCPWAWADIQRDVAILATGGDFPWVNQEGVGISCCTDGFRPVVFTLQRMD